MELKNIFKIALGLIFLLPTILFAADIYMDDSGSITMIKTEKKYYFPESSKSMPEKYHYLYGEGSPRLCTTELSPERQSDDILSINIKDYSDEKGIVTWYCPSVD